MRAQSKNSNRYGSGRGKSSSASRQTSRKSLKTEKPRVNRTKAAKVEKPKASSAGRSKRQLPTPRRGLLACLAMWTAGVSLGVLFLACLSVLFLYGYRFATTHPQLALRHIEITGNERLSQEEVSAAAGLRRGMNLLELDLKALEERLAVQPWVKGVSVTRTFPDRLSLKVVEKTPVFWIAEGGTLAYADEHGAYIAPVTQNDIASLPQLVRIEGVGNIYVKEVLEAFAQAELPMDIKDAAWLRSVPGRSVEVYFEDANLSVTVDMRTPQASMQRLSAVLEDLKRRGRLHMTRAVTVRGEKAWSQALNVEAS
jgi:cell division protein FtsQ